MVDEGQGEESQDGSPLPDMDEEQAAQVQAFLNSDDDFIEVEPDENDLFSPEDETLQTFLIDTGTEDEEGRAKKIKVIMRDPRSPALGAEFASNFQDPRAFANVCKVLIVEPKMLVEERPVMKRKGVYVSADGKGETDDPQKAQKKTGVLLTRSAMQNGIRMKAFKVLGITADFFSDLVEFNLSQTKSVLRRFSKSSQRNTADGPQNGLSKKQETTDTTKEESAPNSSSPTPSSNDNDSETSKTSPTSQKPSSAVRVAKVGRTTNR